MRPRYFAYLILVVLYEDTPPPRNGTYQIISAVPKNQQEVHRDRVHFNVWYFVSCFWNVRTQASTSCKLYTF